MNITIHVHAKHNILAVEMPGVTSVVYAAKRAAAAHGYDGAEHHWALVPLQGSQALPDDALIVDYAGRHFRLGVQAKK